MSSLDSRIRILGSFRCSATQSVVTSISGYAYPFSRIFGLGVTCGMASSPRVMARYIPRSYEVEVEDFLVGVQVSHEDCGRGAADDVAVLVQLVDLPRAVGLFIGRACPPQ